MARSFRSRLAALHLAVVAAALAAVGVALADVPHRRLGLALGAGLLAGGVLGLAAAFLASRSLRARADALAAFAGAVARGDAWESTRARLGLTGSDELKGLEAHLAATARDLQTYIAALAEQRRRVEAIVGSMDEGLIVVTGAGEVLLMNGVAEGVLGVAPGAWRGRRLLELTRDPDLHGLLDRAASGEGRAAGEVRLATLPPRDLAVSVTPLRGPEGAEGPPGGAGRRAAPGEGTEGAAPGEGAALGYVVVIRDVTRLKKLERMRTDFVANVSHELKTPLAAIRASLETLADWALEDPAGARRYVAICLSHAERLQRLIDDLLVLSNIELGQVRLSRRPVDLEGAVDETFELLSTKAEERGVRLVKAIPDRFPRLLVDRNRLLQILLNLVDNAIKFTPSGGMVTVSGEPASGPWGAVVVADTGIGVPKADLPRLGERFHRVDKGRSREAGGTGLGLAIVKHLAQLHGGRLEITSEVGRGTTVRVVLPLAPSEALPAGAP